MPYSRPFYLLAPGWAFGCLLLLSRSAVAAEWLIWSPPPECPQAAHVRGRVEEWLDGVLPGPERLVVRGDVRWTGNRWLTTVVVRLDGQTRQRTVEVEHCSDAADFVALTTVLAVDPENQQAGERDGHDIAPPSIEAADAAPAQTETVSAKPAIRVTTETIQNVTPKRASTVTVPSGAFALAAQGAVGTLPGVSAGVAAHGAISWAPLQVRVGVRGLLPATRAVPGAVAPIEFSFYAAQISGCYLTELGSFVLGPCVTLEGGAILADQKGEGSLQKRITTPLLGLGAQAEAAFPLAETLQLFASVGFGVPITQTRLVLSDGKLVHQAQWGANADLGVKIIFGGN